MNYFQQYETERRPFQVGKKFIRVDPSAIGQFSDTRYEIVVILSIREYSYSVRCLSGVYSGQSFQIGKESFRAAYEPYEGEISTQEEDDE